MIEPERAPYVDGVKVTFMVQLEPAPRLGPQLLLGVNSGESSDAMLVIASELVPVFLSVMPRPVAVVPTLVLGKVRLVGVNWTPGAFTPVPVSETLWLAPFEALSIMFSVPVLVPDAAGVKVIEMVQAV